MNGMRRFQKYHLSYGIRTLYHHLISMTMGFAPFGHIIAFFDIFYKFI